MPLSLNQTRTEPSSIAYAETSRRGVVPGETNFVPLLSRLETHWAKSASFPVTSGKVPLMRISGLIGCLLLLLTCYHIIKAGLPLF
jgi:hypothetical protein